MEFNILTDMLIDALDVIKGSKALDKIDDKLVPPLCIEATNASGNQTKFLASSACVWSSSLVTDDDFASMTDAEKFFAVKDPGKYYVDGNLFIDVLSTYPKGTIVNIKIEEKKDSNSEYLLKVVCERPGKKGRVKSTGFPVLETPPYFEDEPVKEDRIEKKILAQSLATAINSVEFASGTDEKWRFCWGVQIELFDNEISTFATDRFRLCWYDEKGFLRSGNQDNPPVTFAPIKSSLVSAVKKLKLSDPVTLEIGPKYTILRQKNQYHAIPNIEPLPEDSEVRLPNWRGIAQSLEGDASRVSFKIPKKILMEFIRSAALVSNNKYGIKLCFDTDEKQIVLSVEQIESGGIFKSSHKEIEPIEDGSFSGSLNHSFVLQIETLKEIISKLDSETIIFRLKKPGENEKEVVEIYTETSNFKYMTSVV